MIYSSSDFHKLVYLFCIFSNYYPFPALFWDLGVRRPSPSGKSVPSLSKRGAASGRNILSAANDTVRTSKGDREPRQRKSPTTVQRPNLNTSGVDTLNSQTLSAHSRSISPASTAPLSPSKLPRTLLSGLRPPSCPVAALVDRTALNFTATTNHSQPSRLPAETD